MMSEEKDRRNGSTARASSEGRFAVSSREKSEKSVALLLSFTRDGRSFFAFGQWQTGNTNVIIVRSKLSFLSIANHSAAAV
jgi:hypothetical protein